MWRTLCWLSIALFLMCMLVVGLHARQLDLSAGATWRDLDARALVAWFVGLFALGVATISMLRHDQFAPAPGLRRQVRDAARHRRRSSPYILLLEPLEVLRAETPSPERITPVIIRAPQSV